MVKLSVMNVIGRPERVKIQCVSILRHVRYHDSTLKIFVYRLGRELFLIAFRGIFNQAKGLV